MTQLCLAPPNQTPAEVEPAAEVDLEREVENKAEVQFRSGVKDFDLPNVWLL